MIAQECPTPKEAADQILGWFGETMDAGHWFSLNDVEPHKAAMLLCRFDPNDETLEQAQRTTTDVTGPRDLVRLVQRFEDLAKTAPRPRPLLQWLHEARQMGAQYHPWVDQYAQAAQLETKAEPGAAATPASKPTQRRVLGSTIQDNNIIAKLVEHGHDPLRMPKAPRGNAPWPIRKRVSNELNYTKDVMKKAWTRLRQEGRIKDA